MRTGHNLLLRLYARRGGTLRFLHDPSVPFANKKAERGIPMIKSRIMKLRMKISGSFRRQEGAEDFATIRGFLSTARKQG